MIRFIGFFIISSFLIFGCGGSQDNSSGGSILVEVSKGNPTSRPIYVWFDSTNTNPGTAEKITVAKKSDLNTIVWGVQSVQPNQDLITSPYTQGDVPSNVTAFVSTELDLQSGITYRITIFKVDNTSGFVEYTVP
jgi:hypothetical protein